MEALISGRAEVALISDGGLLSAIRGDNPEETFEVRPEEGHLLLGGARDLELVEAAGVEEIREKLLQAMAQQEALDLALICLDKELSAATRAEAAGAMDDVLPLEYVAEFLDRIFLSHELPASADIGGATSGPITGAYPRTSAFFKKLESLQDWTRKVRLALEDLPQVLFGSRENRDHFISLMRTKGIVRDLILTLDQGSETNELMAKALALPELEASPIYLKAFSQWIDALDVEKKTPRMRREVREREEDRKEDRKEEAAPRRKNRRSFDRKKAKENVDQTKDAIEKAMRERRFSTAGTMTRQLIIYHLNHDGADLVCKTLCDLAQRAKKLGLPEWQLDFTRNAIEKSPVDGRSWIQHVDALLAMGKLPEALSATKNAIDFSNHMDIVVAQNGRAEVLKAMGRLPESLQAYEKVMADHPDEVVPQNGRAEVLKAMGRLDEARQAYEKVMADHPENVVAQSGRAEVLKAMGRLEEARQAYETVMADHPEDVFAQNGRAEVLKAMGRLEEARRAYETVMADHPENVVAQSGRAEVLKAMGRLDEARQAYEKVMADHPENVVAQSGRAEVLKAMGRLEEARRAYETVMADHPENVVAQSGRAEVLKAMGRLEEARKAYETVMTNHPEDVFAQSGRAEVLKAMGRLDEARQAYETVMADHPENVVAQSGRAEVLKAMGRLDEARQAYETVMAEHPENVVAQNGRAEVLKAMGRLEEARKAYETVMADHPENVFAQTGRAEVLKAMGRLDEALEAYREIVATHPFDQVAHNGMACVLVLMDRNDEALKCLPASDPRTEQDWIGYHIRGMIHLRQGRLDEAIAIFDRGVKECFLFSHRDYFRNALAVALLRKQDSDSALKVLEEVRTPAMKIPANLLRLHAHGLQRNSEGIARADDELPQEPAPPLRDVLLEMRSRFVRGAPARYDDEWVLYQETQVLLAA